MLPVYVHCSYTVIYTSFKHYIVYSTYYTLLLWCGMGKTVEYSPWHVCTALSCIDAHSVTLAHALYSIRGADHDPWINKCAHALTLYMCVCVCIHQYTATYL